MDKQQLKKISDELLNTFIVAGERSIKLRQIGLKKEIKSDNTPVTNGDIEVNKILTEKIKNITPNIPIVSEESTSNKSNNEMTNFWLIDPIDGTHDYINNKDEFTLNAGLIINKKPELGIIYAPAKKRLFYTYAFGSSFELIDEKEIKLTCEKKTDINQVKAVSYSQNLKPMINELHKKFGVTEHLKMKSSLKFCVIAASEFDLYVAEPRASEWDIAAGHAILKNAGGIVSDFDGNEILYGKKDFKNPGLILKRSENL
jgi:3'(2'), 5'-bisphosphate nucleotidase